MFADIKVEWNGEEKVLRSNKILRTIAGVEEIITVQDLAGYGDAKNIRITKLTAAYGHLLRATGFSVTDEDVYSSILAPGADSGKSATVAQEAVINLLSLMIPKRVTSEAEAGKVISGNESRAARKLSSSRKSTRA